MFEQPPKQTDDVLLK